MKKLDALHRVFAAEEHVEFWLLAEPLVEAIHDAVDLVADHAAALLEESQVIG
ncbi:MAG: hypothetical protein WA441_03140 [Methyloceanibacter sp.]